MIYGVDKMKIKEILLTSDSTIAVLILENNKQVTRKLRKGANDYYFFKYNNQGYFLDNITDLKKVVDN